MAKSKGDVDYTLVDLPNLCPYCHRHINPIQMVSRPWRIGHTDYDNRLDAAYGCPSDECGRMFLGFFTGSMTPDGPKRNFVKYKFSEAAPATPQVPVHPEEILVVSTSFVEIYKQASFAEAYGLVDIAGGAYRKALEFLIKDYCISKFPDDEAQIKEKFLGHVIRDHVEDMNIRKCAERAAWLGNDETHYERRWVDRDINDLKTLIRLTSNWIENDVLTAQYAEDMQR